jgi:hypothetical protein
MYPIPVAMIFFPHFLERFTRKIKARSQETGVSRLRHFDKPFDRFMALSNFEGLRASASQGSKNMAQGE